MVNHPNRTKANRARRICSTRVCSFCGLTVKPTRGGMESTYGFATTIRSLGFTGEKAHRSCLLAEVNRQERQKKLDAQMKEIRP